MALEDEFGDVIRKARVGLRLSPALVAARAGLTAPELERAERYEFTPGDAIVRTLAAVLNLKAPALLDLARKRYDPAPTEFESPGTTAMIHSDYGGGIVNCYAAWDKVGGQAAFFDTGVDFQALVELQARHGFDLRYVFVTHTHGDHIGVLEEVRQRWRPTIVAGASEPLREAELVDRDTTFGLGQLRILAFPTPGHSAGGLSFRVDGFGAELPPLCMCGDTLFAGSAGGPTESYTRLMHSVRNKLLTMDARTILCPGHGPLTTVAQEKLHNPFA